MATRRRRSTTKPAPEVVETTHEEMLEVAAEREAIEEVVEEEVPMEVILSAALADTFEAIQKAEEEQGVEDFFETPPAQSQVTRPPVILEPAPEIPAPRLEALLNRQPRYLLRQSRHPKYNSR